MDGRRWPNRHQEGERRQQILDIEREVKELAIRRREERMQDAILIQDQHEQERQLYRNGPFMPQRLNMLNINFPIRNREAGNQPHIPRETAHWQVEPEQRLIHQDEHRPNPSAPPMLETVSTNTYPYPQTDYVDFETRREQEQRPFRLYPSGPHMPPRLINSSTNQAEYSQQITDIMRDAQRRRRPHSNTSHMASRFNNTSTTASPNLSTDYLYAPPMTPESEIISHLRFPDPPSLDDGLPTYEEAIAIDYSR